MIDPKDFLELLERRKSILSQENIIFGILMLGLSYLLLVLVHSISLSLDGRFDQFIFVKVLLKYKGAVTAVCVLLAGYLTVAIFPNVFGKIRFFISKLRNNFFPSQLSLTKDQDFERRNLVQNFEFQGVLRNEFNGRRCIFLNSSSEGLITKKRFGSCSISFTAEIVEHGFGIVLCAADLENYFMFRINGVKDDNRFKIHITPHVRKSGIWEIQEIKDNPVSVSNIVDFEISINEKIINIVIKDGQTKKKDFTYTLPSFFPLLPAEGNLGTPQNIVTRVVFPNFGKIGFRAWGPDEKAIIYNLEIKKL